MMQVGAQAHRVIADELGSSFLSGRVSFQAVFQGSWGHSQRHSTARLQGQSERTAGRVLALDGHGQLEFEPQHIISPPEPCQK